MVETRKKLEYTILSEVIFCSGMAKVIDHIVAKNFKNKEIRLLFTICKDMWEKDMAIDSITVAEYAHVHHKEQFQKIASCIVELSGYACSSAHIHTHCLLLIQLDLVGKFKAKLQDIASWQILPMERELILDGIRTCEQAEIGTAGIDTFAVVFQSIEYFKEQKISNQILSELATFKNNIVQGILALQQRIEPIQKINNLLDHLVVKIESAFALDLISIKEKEVFINRLQAIKSEVNRESGLVQKETSTINVQRSAKGRFLNNVITGFQSKTEDIPF